MVWILDMLGEMCAYTGMFTVAFLVCSPTTQPKVEYCSPNTKPKVEFCSRSTKPTSLLKEFTIGARPVYVLV